MANEEKYRANLFGFDRTKKSQQEITMRVFLNQMNELRTKLGLCYLCGGDHSKEVPRSVQLTCPTCKKSGAYNVMPHCPGGVSHGETHKCPACGVENFIVVYYDGGVVMERTLKPQIP